ncbi:putative tyramine receptor 2 [Ochlerotatus camptorhynchus]|uniref:putative tyramine receptor 2 n=1 Tax=Ochlerotatus camptorhynchus TaxID=644619 RepID=UPI0031D7BF80
MTDTPFVYGVELKSPPPTTETDQLTQYDRFLKTKNMTEHFLQSAHLQHHQHHSHHHHHHQQAMDQTSSLLVNGDYYYTTPNSSLSDDASNLTSSLGQILRHNIMAEWSLRGGSSAVTAATTGTTPHEAVVVAATGGTGTGGSSAAAAAAASRGSGDSTFQNNLIIPLYAVIFLLSVVGNLLVILTLAQNKRMRTVTNVYLLNLAISDLLLGVFCMPFTLVGQVLRKFIFGSIMCKLIPYFQAVSVSVAVWTLVAISLERYFAICRPLSSRRWQTQFHAYKMIALVWTLSFLVNSPLCYVQRLQPVQRLHAASSNVTFTTSSQQQPSMLPPMKCREMWPDKSYERAYVLFLDAGLLCFPLLTMGFAYSMIVSKLWRGLRREIRHSTHQKHQLRITNSTPTSMNAVAGSKLLPSRSQESGCYLLTATPPIISSNSNLNRGCCSTASTGANNNYCYSSYGNNVLHYRGGGGGGGAGMDSMGPTVHHGNAAKQRSGVRFRMLKNFVESHRPKCSKPIIALNSTTIISPSPPPSYLNCTGSQMMQLNNLSASSTMTTIATSTTTPTSETVLNDRITTSSVSTPALVVGSRFRESSNSTTTTTTTAGDKGLSMTVTTATPITSPDPPVLPMSSSFSRHAIRSNYMDKSIEAKKKVIRMLFVIIMEFFVCWAPLHILNTVYLYSPAFVYKYVSSNGIALVQLMAYISSCCNPITYCFMNRRFRQAFLNIFGCYRHRLFLCMCCCFRCGPEDTQLDAESKSAGSKANPSNTCGPGAVGNNSDISGNDSLAFAGRSIVQRSEIMVLESEDRV